MEHGHRLTPGRQGGEARPIRERTLPVDKRIDCEVVGGHRVRRPAPVRDGGRLGAAAQEPPGKLHEIGVADEVRDVCPEAVIRAAKLREERLVHHRPAAEALAALGRQHPF